MTPFPNTSDTIGQSGTYYLSSEVEPNIAVDPQNPLHLAGAFQQDRWSNGGARGIVSAVSTDGGVSWTTTPIPGATVNSGGSTLRASDPWVTIARNGDVYAGYLTINDPNLENPRTVSISKSTDGGLSWGSPIALFVSTDNNFFNDKDTITADPTNSNYVYAVWDRLDFAGNRGPTMFSRTSDGGHTWSAPANIFDPANGQTISNQIVVLPGGRLINMCVHIDYTTNTENIVVLTSSDKGTTWSGPIEVSAVQSKGVTDPDTGAGVRTGGDVPEIAVDPKSGNLYVAWQDSRFSSGSHDDIALAMSADGGATWSAPIKVNQTPGNILAADQQAFTPALAVGANGTLAVSYYDFRNNTTSSGLPTDAWIAFANPGQQPLVFGNEQRLTDVSFNMELAPNASGYFTGDYEGLIAGGKSFNTFGAFFSQAVSAQDPTSIFFRGALPPNTLSPVQLASLAPIEGHSAGGTLATFGDSSTHPDLSAYEATVTWGDGSTDNLNSGNGGIVKNGDGSFSVIDSHTYAEEAANITYAVSIVDNGGGSAGSSASFAVTDAALTAALKTISASEGAAVSGATVATFTDADPAGAAGDYSASVNWGDGDTTASISIVADGSVAGQFDVVATKSHPYGEGGNYAVTVNIADTGGAGVVAHSSAAVSDSALAATSNSFVPTEGINFSVIVASFTDADTTEPLSSYTASINWGDGKSSSGTLRKTATAGLFRVVGSHIYTEAGTYSVTVSINDSGGGFAQTTLNERVKDGALSGSAVSFGAVRGQLFSGFVANFSDADPLGELHDFSSRIRWGDGTSSLATVTVNSSGGFSIKGSHKYSTAGTFTFSVVIADVDGARLTVNGTATVSGPMSAASSIWDSQLADLSWMDGWCDNGHRHHWL
jgi:hypothetical protein